MKMENNDHVPLDFLLGARYRPAAEERRPQHHASARIAVLEDDVHPRKRQLKARECLEQLLQSNAKTVAKKRNLVSSLSLTRLASASPPATPATPATAITIESPCPSSTLSCSRSEILACLKAKEEEAVATYEQLYRNAPQSHDQEITVSERMETLYGYQYARDFLALDGWTAPIRSEKDKKLALQELRKRNRRLEELKAQHQEHLRAVMAHQHKETKFRSKQRNDTKGEKISPRTIKQQYVRQLHDQEVRQREMAKQLQELQDQQVHYRVQEQKRLEAIARQQAMEAYELKKQARTRATNAEKPSFLSTLRIEDQAHEHDQKQQHDVLWLSPQDPSSDTKTMNRSKPRHTVLGGGFQAKKLPEEDDQAPMPINRVEQEEKPSLCLSSTAVPFTQDRKKRPPSSHRLP